MRILFFTLAGLVVLIQYPLWLGKGGWLRVWDLSYNLTERRAQNRQLQARNDALEAEVRDLKSGYDAIEERARFELGMIRNDEVFILTPNDRPGVVKQAARPTPQ